MDLVSIVFKIGTRIQREAVCFTIFHDEPLNLLLSPEDFEAYFYSKQQKYITHGDEASENMAT